MKPFQRKFLGFGMLLFLTFAAGMTVIILQYQQKIHTRASNQTAIPAAVCGTAPLDIMLIIDNSGSMNTKIGTQNLTKLQAAITAAQNFVTIISANTNNHIGLVSFSTTATLNSKLTTDYATVNSQIGLLKPAGNTCHQCAALTANQELHTDGRANVQKVAIFLTDGIANTIVGHTGQVSAATAEQAALTEIQNGFTADKTAYFTIGLGTDVNTTFLQKIATMTKAQYFFTPSSDQLNQTYQTLSQILGKGSISGTVFNDSNNNGSLDTGEASLNNWNVDLKVGTPTSTSMLTTTTASTSGYSFTGLCDGTYYINEETQPGWTQTEPATPSSYYTVSVLSGNAVANKDFGNAQRACGTSCTSDASCNGAINGCSYCNPDTNKCSVPVTPTAIPTMTPTPTPTAMPAAMTLGINALLHNIGNSGDNVNPTAASFSNKNPLHPTRNVQAFVFDLDNNQVADASGTILYSSSSGSFKGTVDLGTTIPGGKYYIKIQSDYHLRRLIPGIQTLSTGTTNALPTVSLIAGDANNDNQLDILDYNLLLGCYSVNNPAAACTPALKLATDFNDDGNVNDIDFNLFIRELAVQSGE